MDNRDNLRGYFRPTRSRGGNRGRGGYFPTPTFSRFGKPLPYARPANLGKTLETICSRDLKPARSTPTVIRNVEEVASFNWVGSVEAPTVVIPGVPPRWCPPVDAPQLHEDTGDFFRDINAAFSSTHPLHGTALSILENATVSTSSIDLVACAATLRALFAFIRNDCKTFRIIVEVVGDTVFFVRREGSPRETIPGIRGYGYAMPEAYTDWHKDVRGSMSHQRVLRYRFAGMDCLVHYESDGYLPDTISSKMSSGLVSPREQDISANGDIDLETAMRESAVSHKVIADQAAPSNLTIRRAGMRVPQSATFELKTRSVKRKDEDFFAEFGPRMWLTQTPYFILGFHTRGQFNDIRVRDVREDVVSWESQNQESIKRFAGLIEWVVQRVLKEPDGMIELWRHESGDLEILTPGAECNGALPPDVEDKWTSIDETDDESSSGDLDRGVNLSTNLVPDSDNRDDDHFGYDREDCLEEEQEE